MTVAGWLVGPGKGGRRGGGGRPLPCNFKRGKREGESGRSYWHGHLHACISREGEAGKLHVGGESEGKGSESEASRITLLLLLSHSLFLVPGPCMQ